MPSQVELAIDRWQGELAQRPSAGALAALVSALVEADRADEALLVAQRAVEHDPRAAASWATLGRAQAALGNYPAAVSALGNSARARRSSATHRELTAPAPFLLHNIEQAEYLVRSGNTDPELAQFSLPQLEALRLKLLRMMSDTPNEVPFVSIRDAAFSVANLPTLSVPMVGPAHCLNPTLDFMAIDAGWDRGPRFQVLDGFLSSEAFKALQHFCLCSTSYRRPYRFGYVGAFPEDGFACELLLRVADELRQALPRLFAGLRLMQWWAFVYDRDLPGTDLHGDDAELSLNLWLTNDAANLDPGGGGLVIWNESAPADWTFNDYNSGGSKVSNYLRDCGAEPTVISYAANRAVLFEGRLFHRTDGTRFAEGFENRRRNLTLLFRRGAA